MKSLFSILLLCLCSGPLLAFDPVVKTIEGWTIHIDPALINDDPKSEESQSLEMLQNHLFFITHLVPEERLKELRTLEIWIEKKHPSLGAMQYHPSREWLVNNGHDARLAKKVHIPHAKALVSRSQLMKHPMVVLHELAHAYHDQILGFDDPRIVKVFQKAKESGKYRAVLLYNGRRVLHYGMTNHKEYFAEGTEAFFNRNDFYPFVQAELKSHDPDFHALLEEIWERLHEFVLRVFPGDPFHGPYHDNEYGFPVEDDNLLFERLVLEINQAGLSWLTILKKKETFRAAYDDFEIEKIAGYGEADRDRLLSDSGIIRNRLKVDAAIYNAQVILSLQASHGSFLQWLEEHHPIVKPEWVKLFKRTFRFTGGEITGEFLMSTGYLPGAHRPECPIYGIIEKQNPPWMRSR